jgi:hypothetical protein
VVADFPPTGRLVSVKVNNRSYWYFDQPDGKGGQKRRYVGPGDDDEITPGLPEGSINTEDQFDFYVCSSGFNSSRLESVVTEPKLYELTSLAMEADLQLVARQVQ